MNVRRVVIFAVLVVAVAVGFAVPVLASSAAVGDVPHEEVPTLVNALGQLATAAGTVVAGGVVSLLLEQKAAWFKRLDSEAKWATVFGISVALSILAKLANTHIPDHVFQVLEPYWQIVGGAFLLWFGSQATHLLSKFVDRFAEAEV